MRENRERITRVSSDEARRLKGETDYARLDSMTDDDIAKAVANDPDAPPLDVESYSWHGFADDVLAVAAHLDVVGDPTLVACGHSKGGASLFLGEVEKPGSFPRIWAFEPIVFPRPEVFTQGENPLARGALRRRNEWSSTDEAFQSYASKPPLEVMTEEALRAYVDYGFRDRGDGVFELKCRPEVEAATYAMATVNGVWDLLPGVTPPVLVGCGDRSHSVGPEDATRIAERLPNARVEVFAGLGHFGPQQDPDAIAASIVAFQL